MDPEMKGMVRELLELTKENNAMLKGMRRGLVWGRIFGLLYWIVIAGGFIASYYYLEPYIKSMKDAYAQAMTATQKANNIFNPNAMNLESFQNMIKQFQEKNN